MCFILVHIIQLLNKSLVHCSNLSQKQMQESILYLNGSAILIAKAVVKADIFNRLTDSNSITKRISHLLV